MKRFKISAFWQAVLVILGVYIFLSSAFPPIMPKALMIQYMVITIVGVLLYFSFDNDRWAEFMAPILSVIADDNKWILRWFFLILIPSVAAYQVYSSIRPTIAPPVELRQVHPAPPSTLKAFGKTFDLATLENPVRTKILEEMKSVPAQGKETYRLAVESGKTIYYQNCFYCHGDLLNGEGPYSNGLNPLPANFRDVGTIAQLQESFLFWRIATGGPGLPKEGTPWNSAMPVWQEMLSEADIWNVITFLYDHVDQVPRMWDQETSKIVTGMKEDISRQRQTMKGPELYQHHCAVCHGSEGMGDGPAAEFLYPKPRDFTTGFFKFKNSPYKTLPPTNADIFHTIHNGLPGTAMPAWGELLSEKEIHSLIDVIKGFDVVGTWAPENAQDEDFDEEGRYLKQALDIIETIKVDNQIPFTEASVALGKKAFRNTCAQCHGEEGRGNPNVSKRLKDEWDNRIWPRDLTKPWTWRVTEVTDNTEETIRNIYTRLSVGIPGTPMPAHADKLEAEERWNIANYVYTLRQYTAALTETPLIVATKVAGDLPDDVTDIAWANTRSTTLFMLPNVMKGERLFKALTNAVTVRALYNDDEIAFQLEMDDRTHSRPGDLDAEKTQDSNLQLFPDAFAIQTPKESSFSLVPVVEKPMFRHGDKRHATTIWYWNAGSLDPLVNAYSTIFDAKGVDQKLQPRANSTDLFAKGEWVNGRWRIIMKHKRQSENSDDVSFSEGRFIPISFANWDGSNGETKSKHTLTSWYWLLLPPPANYLKIISIPLGTAGILFLLGLMIIRRIRR